METIVIIVIEGLILFYLDALRAQMDQIQGRQKQLDRKVLDLLEHIAGGLEAAREARQNNE